MHGFFGFPFQLAPLLYWLALSAASWAVLLLGAVIPQMAALLLVELGIGLAACRYAFRIVQQTSQGFLHSRDFLPDWERSHIHLPWKLLGVLLVWGVVAGLLGAMHPLLSLALNVALSLAMPAIVITLAQDGSFRQSLNPAAWWRVIHGVGRAYAVLVLFVILLSQGSDTALAWLLPRVSPEWLLPAANAVALYFVLVMASLVGYVMYEHHDALGVDLKRGPREAGDAPGHEAAVRTREADRHVSEMVTSGNLDHALDVAYEAQRGHPEDLAAHARYHQVLTLMSHKNEALGHHAARYIPLLLRKDLTSRAVDVFKLCQARGAAVALDNPEHLLAVARHLWRQGEAEAALAALQDVEKTYPHHAQLPAALELMVRVLVQSLQRKDQAVALVKTLEARYPTSPHTEEARWLVR